MRWLGHHQVAVFGTIALVVVAGLANYFYSAYLHRAVRDRSERFRRQGAFKTILVVAAGVLIIILWARLLQHTGTFLGILGAGVAVAVREPLLSIAGRIAILAGGMYGVGDRIQLNQMSGDVIAVGFFIRG